MVSCAYAYTYTYNKSPGPDGVFNEVLKMLPSEI